MAKIFRTWQVRFFHWGTSSGALAEQNPQQIRKRSHLLTYAHPLRECRLRRLRNGRRAVSRHVKVDTIGYTLSIASALAAVLLAPSCCSSVCLVKPRDLFTSPLCLLACALRVQAVLSTRRWCCPSVHGCMRSAASSQSIGVDGLQLHPRVPR